MRFEENKTTFEFYLQRIQNVDVVIQQSSPSKLLRLPRTKRSVTLSYSGPLSRENRG